MRLALALLAPLWLVGCCCGISEDCEPYSYEARCSEGGFTYCQTNRGYGIDFGNEVTRVECADDQTCIDLGMGQLACVLSPATPCDPTTFVGRCEHGVPVLCTSPSNLVTENYVVGGADCTGNTNCAVVENHASCYPDQPPCPLPAGQTSACMGSTLVMCAEGPTGLEETMRLDCSPQPCTEVDVNGQAFPRCGE